MKKKEEKKTVLVRNQHGEVKQFPRTRSGYASAKRWVHGQDPEPDPIPKDFIPGARRLWGEHL